MKNINKKHSIINLKSINKEFKSLINILSQMMLNNILKSIKNNHKNIY